VGGLNLFAVELSVYLFVIICLQSRRYDSRTTIFSPEGIH